MSQKKISIFIFAVTLLIPIQIPFAQSFPLKHYSAKDGLASSIVNCILQDSRGYLWFGTENGLSRFNGSKFQNFLAEADGLKSDYITDLLEDRRGYLWIGTRGGGLICMSPNRIKTYTTTDGLPNNRIFSIAEDREGKLWLGTRSGISTFDGRDFTTYTKKDGLIDDFVTDVIIDKKGNLWIGTQRGLSYLEKKNGKSRFINYTTSNGLVNKEIYTLMTDRKGNTWIGTKEGLSCFQKKGATFISYSTKDGMADNFVNAIIEDRGGNIWIGTQGGISRFSPSLGRFTNYYAKNGFPSDRIYTIYEDREGNIWFGTNIGVSRLNSLKISNFSIKDGLPDNFIWAIIEERENKYWVGTDKGLCRYYEGTFKTYTTRDGLINNSILNLMKDRAGNIWIATTGGLSFYSPKSGKFTNYTKDDGLPGEIVIALAEDSKGTLWIGTDKGLCRLINRRIVPANFDFKQDSLPVHAILNDRRGNLWFSDTRGLRKILNPGEESTNYSYHYSARDGLIHNEIISLFEDSQGRIWIGTKRGLSCFSDGKFTNYTTSNGLSHNVCLFILEDDNRNVWIGTGNGINRFDGKTFKTYTSKDGLISNEMRDGACLKDSRGNLWFGTVNGLIRFNPRLDRENTVPPPVYITHFSVWGKGHPISPNIRLKYDQNYLRFDFIALCFTSPEDVLYKYRLEGVDRDWIETGNRDTSYSSLAPGDYSFKVIAKNNDGIESLKPAEIHFRILSPFWQTWWFRMLTAALFLFFLFFLHRVRTIRIRQVMEKERLEKELKLRADFTAMLFHELRSPLTAVMGYGEMLNDVPEQMDLKKTGRLISRSSEKMLNLINDMLDFSKFEAGKMALNKKNESIENIIMDTVGLMTPLFSTKEIKLVCKLAPSIKERELVIDPEKIGQVLSNFLSNASKFAPKKGMVIVEAIETDEGTLEVSVTDNGPGIPKINQKYLFNKYAQLEDDPDVKGTGLGLAVSKLIVESHGGTIGYRPSKDGNGSMFFFRLPFSQKRIGDIGIEDRQKTY